MPRSLWGGTISSRRGLLALLWMLVSALTAIAFIVASIVTISAKSAYNDNDQYDYNNNQDNKEDNSDMEPEMAVTSRAMAFAALWTAVLATLMGIYGTVTLGWQSPTGQYYTCCSSQVHRTTPLSLGSFIGALLMFANMTLVCSVLFGEFQIRDYIREAEERGRDNNNDQTQSTSVSRSSVAFSIMCVFLTVMYAGFAALTYAFSNSILEELAEEEREEAMLASTRNKITHFVGGYDGYIGERFDVRRTGGFVSQQPAGTLT